MTRYFYFLTLILLILGCGDDSNSPASTDPSNLQVTITNLDDGLGNISVQATGDNVVEFEFDPGDGSELESNSTGDFAHSYSSSGSYTLEVKAYGESGRFLLEESVVSITLDNDNIPAYEGFLLVWNDEFNSTSLDETIWNYELGAGGWGNNELQNYRKENTQVSGGNLVITIKEENFNGSAYTSSRLTTQGKYTFKYGRVDIGAKLPEGQGLWPALWMLGANFGSVGWPACGEIDMMEMIGGSGRENTVHGTLHWQDPNGNSSNGFQASFGKAYVGSTSFSDDFHLYSIIWNESTIEWLVDGISYQTQGITDPNKDEFQKSFFFIINTAVGGTWPGSPDNTTTFPQEMKVDFIRVYQ